LGGYNISVTKGIFNRVEIIPYFSVARGIALQVDASVNPGNSGGPAVNVSGQMIGVAFSGKEGPGIENMGYIIPPVIISYFIDYFIKTKRKPFPGLCNLNVEFQTLQNETLIQYYGINHGVIIMKAQKPLQEGDVLISIDGWQIGNDGTIALEHIFQEQRSGEDKEGSRNKEGSGNKEGSRNKEGRSGEIIPFESYISLKKPGDKLQIAVWRNGKEKKLTILAKPKVMPIPNMDYHASLDYLIVMGIVFLPLSWMLMKEKNDDGAYMCHLVELAKHNDRSAIILSDTFTTKFTQGYSLDNQVLHSVNGTIIRDMKQLVQIIEQMRKKGKENFIQFEFLNTSRKIIIRASDIKKYDDSIRTENIGDIPRFRI
jgi:hypothetical protein